MAQAPADLATWEAITLFVERACAVQPGFQLTNENAADVAAICQRLDGLPLAIELAAARIKLLAPATIVDRLERRFPLLTSGTRDAPPRQRTLQAAIAWSYDLLEPHQQALLRCLAVFAGGWTLEAAEIVGSRCGVPEVLDALATLVEQSLVVRDDGGPDPRYRLLETIREFALDQLVAAGDEEHARGAHVDYLLHLARENDLERLDADVGARLDRLKAEEANLRTGIAWALDHDPESALAVLAELDPTGCSPVCKGWGATCWSGPSGPARARTDLSGRGSCNRRRGSRHGWGACPGRAPGGGGLGPRRAAR